MGDSCVVDEDVHWAKLFFNFGDHALDLGGDGNVSPHRLRLSP